MTAIEPDLEEWRERAEFWASRDPNAGLYDKDAVAFANEVVLLLSLLRDAHVERDNWKGRAQRAEATVNEAHTYCARPEGVCLPIDRLPLDEERR